MNSHSQIAHFLLQTISTPSSSPGYILEPFFFLFFFSNFVTRDNHRNSENFYFYSINTLPYSGCFCFRSSVITNQIIMAHLLTPAPTTAATALSAGPRKRSSLYSWKNGYFPTPRVCCAGNQYQHQVSDQDQAPPTTRDDHSLPRRYLLSI